MKDRREPDLGPLVGSTQALAEVLQADQLVVLESTTYPGTTRERVVPILEESGLAAGRDFHVAFSPERVDPGRTDFTLRNTPKVIGGLTKACAERAEAIYGMVCDHLLRVATLEAAELTKLLENIFRSVNIALVNELAMLTDRMHIDIWEVVDAAATKPYGFMRFEPGPGMGGHCLPVDPLLSRRAREFDMTTEFIELAGKINQQMPYHCVAKVQRALNDAGRPVKGSRIALLGVSYKPGVGYIREGAYARDGREHPFDRSSWAGARHTQSRPDAHRPADDLDGRWHRGLRDHRAPAPPAGPAASPVESRLGGHRRRVRRRTYRLCRLRGGEGRLRW
jgi:UDP-N-acetyl-D-glucosamine dehydrogenase